MCPDQSQDILLATSDQFSHSSGIWVLCLTIGTSKNGMTAFGLPLHKSSIFHFFFFFCSCRDYSDMPYFGFYKLMTPAVCVRDLELLKRVMIKEFTSFPIPDFKISRKHDKLIAKNPFFLSGEEWQTERKNITRSITSNKVLLWFRSQFGLIFHFCE